MNGAESYWQGLERGELRLRVCANCHQAAFPPMPGCPHCGHQQGEMIRCSGLGKLYSWTVCYHAFDEQFAAETPYVVGLVSLAEGARVIARIEAGDAELHAEMPLRASFPVAGVDMQRLTFVPDVAGNEP